MAAIACAAALTLAGSVAVAVEPIGSEEMEVDIPFAFVANQKAMTAGVYHIGLSGNHDNRVIVEGTEDEGAVVVPVLERLADLGTKEPTLVFDKVDGKFILSEAHYPGMDGFLVGIAGGSESHHVLKGKKHARS